MLIGFVELFGLGEIGYASHAAHEFHPITIFQPYGAGPG